jgi:sugar phosphate isomerase/epimerase
MNTMTTHKLETQPDVAVRDATVTMHDGQSFFDALRELDVVSFELGMQMDGALPGLSTANSEAPFSATDEASATRLKLRLDAENIHVCALLLGTDFSAPNAHEHVAWAVQAVRVAQHLGASTVRIDPLTANSALTMPQIRDNLVRCVGRVLEQSEDSPVELGIENHGAIGNDVEFLDGIFERVHNPRLGMTLDTGNFYWSGLPLQQVYNIIEHLAPRTKHTHIKNIAYPLEMRETSRPTGYEYERYVTPLDEGDIDIARVVRTLRTAGYTRPLCIENEALFKYPLENRQGVVRREVALLRAADQAQDLAKQAEQ